MILRQLTTTTAIMATFLLPLEVPFAGHDKPFLSAAMAQDDNGGDSDDGGGNGGDSDDVSGGGFGLGNGGGSDDRPVIRRRQQAAPSPPPPPPPAFAPDEVVVTDLDPAALATLSTEGFTLVEEIDLSGTGLRLSRLRIPPGLPLPAARDRVRTLPGGGDADFSHFYRSSQGSIACSHENCPALSLVGWSNERNETCRVTVPVGVIDTGVNPDHEILGGAQLDVITLAAASNPPSTAVHGTAIASLLVGNPASRVPGLIPEAEVIAVDVFSRVAGDERTDVAALLRGLDLLLSRGVRVVNLSLAGPPNNVLQTVLDKVQADQQAIIVAAAGNAGPGAPPAWPAAHPAVIAVTAVDSRGRSYRNAQRGDHIDLAAPGVGLLAATSIRGARGKSGTSYAVPFVTAAAAVLLSRNPELDPAAVANRLRQSARDIGALGKDEIFGFGLLDTGNLCAPELQPASLPRAD